MSLVAMGAFDDLILASPPAVRAREQGCDVKPEWANGATITVPHIGAADVEEARIELQPQHYNLRTSSELQLDVSEGDAQRRNRHPRQRSKPSTPHHADTSATSVSKFVHADCPCSVLASAAAVDIAAPCGKVRPL